MAKKKSATASEASSPAGSSRTVRKTTSATQQSSPTTGQNKTAKSTKKTGKIASRVPEPFARGTRAVTRADWEGAVIAFREAVDLDPGNLLYRQKLRSATCAKYRNNSVGDKNCHMAIVRLTVELHEAQQSGDTIRVAQICEDGLAFNPWNADFLVPLAFATQSRGFLDVAKFSMDLAMQCAPDRSDVVEVARGFYSDLGITPRQ